MKKRIPILPIIISLLLLVLTAAFAAAVLRAGLLPTVWTVLLFAALALADALLIFLCAKPGKKLRYQMNLDHAALRPGHLLRLRCPEQNREHPEEHHQRQPPVQPGLRLCPGGGPRPEH